MATKNNKTTEEEIAQTEVNSVDEAVDLTEEIKPEPAQTEQSAGLKRVPQKEKVLTKAQKRKQTAMRLILLNVGILMMSFSVYFFQTPNNFTLGGVAGIAILLSEMIPISWLTQSVVMAIINVLLIILGLIILGKECTFKTIYCSLLYTFVIWLFEFTDVIGHITDSPTLTNQPFLEMVYAILLFGVGGALVFSVGASSGGTDIIALILKKFTKINVGTALMIIDLIVVCIGMYQFADISIALFSFMGLFAKSYLLDSVIENMSKTKYITIITKMPEEVGEFIISALDHSYTMYDAEGGYTGEKKKVLITVCKRSEALKLKSKVKQMDPESFVIITNANEILGKGFAGNF